MMKNHYLLILLALTFSCSENEKVERVTNKEDYNLFLANTNNSTFNSALSEKEFWSKRLRQDSSGVGDLAPLANAYSTMYKSSGEVKYLLEAEKIYRKAINVSAKNKDSYTRSLAQNLISQHRFNDAKLILEKSYKGLSNKRATEHMLFDVYMELGEYKKADTYLIKLKNKNDYNYLIRLAKRNDRLGNLDASIKNLEDAMKIADSRKSIPLQIWTYTNLADFYGHSGRMKDAYQLYLKTLQLQGDNVYAKKQIAWTIYSFEKNTIEANRIIDSIMVNNKNPDYYLFKSEIAKFEGNTIKSKEFEELFLNEVSKTKYGVMYNKYSIQILAETKPKESVLYAEQEIINRTTPETYSLLAYANYKNGNSKKALSIIQQYVEDKTYEPLSLYYSALIFKANNFTNKYNTIKEEISNSSFELGPLLEL